MVEVVSKDGTNIAYEQVGEGPALVLVDGAMCYRSSGPMRPLAQALADQFAVFLYDRRGRGDSGDTAPYAVTREVEDLDALIGAAGGSAFLYGISSGAALALEAAASGLSIRKLALYDPAFTAEGGNLDAKHAYTRELGELLKSGRHGDAVELFMTTVGVPPQTIAGMRQSPFWEMSEAIAPTLAYDDAILKDGTVPRERAAEVAIPTLVMGGDASPDALRRAAKATADALPNGRYQTLAGQSHDVSPEALLPALTKFFADHS